LAGGLTGLSINQEASQKELEGVRKMARRELRQGTPAVVLALQKIINIAGSYCKKTY
jgi:hypothetical protein